jgi:hypothetical protein
MTITAIKQQERLKSRYSIYVDGKYAFSLSADALLEQKLHTGQELDEPQLKVYKKLSADDKAYGLALAYVARRMRSRHELIDYFRRKGYDDDLGVQILHKLTSTALSGRSSVCRGVGAQSSPAQIGEQTPAHPGASPKTCGRRYHRKSGCRG